MRKRFLSGILALVMAVGLLPMSAFAAGEGDASTETTASERDQVTGGINGFMAGLKADTETKDGYKNAFTVDSGSTGATQIGTTYRSPALNGKIWADKSVTADTTNGTFGVTLSALGQTFADTTTNVEKVAFDVVFVLDVSGSMADRTSGSTKTKGQQAVEAINAAMKTLLIGDNTENNRVGIVTFSGTATQSLALAHYSLRSGSSNFLTYNSSSGYGSPSFSISTSTSSSSDSISFTGGTYTQGGIATGVGVLTNTQNNVTPTDGVTHVPVVILLTDGDPTYATSNYSNVGNSNIGSGYANDVKGDDTKYTVLTAVEYKKKLDENYASRYPNDTATAKAKFYTIGQGLTSDYAKALLDPTVEKLTTARNSSETLAKNLANALFPNNAEITNAYSYADGSYVGSMTDDEMTKVFDSILESFTGITGRVDVGESTGGRNNMTFLETLGDGVRFDGAFTLTVPTYKIESGAMVEDKTRTYTLELYKEENGAKVKFDNVTEATTYVEAGNTLYLIPTKVTVNGTEKDLDEENSYDYAAMHNFSATVELQKSTNQRQLSVAIPPALMAYNVLNSSTDAEGKTTYTGYYESDPVQLHYGVAVKDSTQAGEYLISAPNQCYLSFNPSYDGTGEGDDRVYNMPYYWKNQGTLPGDRANKDANATNSDSYVYNTVWGANKDVTIYLGNNGLYTLTGKDLTFNLHWNDENNVDGKRFEDISIQLYKQVVNLDQPGDYNTQYAPPEAVGEPVSLGLSNVPANNSNLWQYTFSGLPVYKDYTYNGVDGTGYVRYWIQFVHDENNGTEDRGYKVALWKDTDGSVNGHLYKQNEDAANETWWWCFSTDKGLLSNAALDVEFTRAREMVTYIIEKKWDQDISEDQQPENIQIQMYANGQAVDATGNSLKEGTTSSPITLYKTVPSDNNPDYATDAWKATLTLPKNSAGGNAILYTPVEVGDAAKDYTATTEYTTSGQNGETIYTATLTNYSSVEKTSLNVQTTWDDNNNQDGLQASNQPTYTLTAKVGESTLSESDLKSLTGLTDLTGTSWSNLPKSKDGSPVTYDVSISGVNAQEYTTSRTEVPGYVFYTLKHTPAAVSITINKDWQDSTDQDGKRPTGGVSGMLYQQVGDSADITTLRTWSTVKSNDNDTVTISNLPKYANQGTQINYYVSEDAVNEYTLSVSGATKRAVNNVDVYPVTINDSNTGTITLTNTHTPITVGYTVGITWDDSSNRDNSRPGSVTVTLVQEATGTSEGGQTYTIKLNVSGDSFTVDNSNSTLPNEATAKWENGKLVIEKLPQYQNQKYQYYSARIQDGENTALTNAGYTVTMTDAKETSNAFTLSYTPGPITLTLTKTWSGDGTPPSTDAYRGYLTLKRSVENGETETVHSYADIKEGSSANTYLVTYTGLDKYDGSGNQYTYSVTESKVPNYGATGAGTDGSVTVEFKNNAATLTNTYVQEKYQTITVTKVWEDNGDDQDKRPNFTVSDGTITSDPLGMTLYAGGQTTGAGIAPSSISENGNVWTYTWSNAVPKYDSNGVAISYYTAYETKEVPGYKVNSDAAVSATTGLTTYYNSAFIPAYEGASGTMTNTLDMQNIETGTLTITKNWNENKYDHSYIGGALSFTVYGTTGDNVSTGYYNVTMENPGTATAGGTVTVSDLPVTANGEKIKYYVVENNVPASYVASYSTDTTDSKAVTLDENTSGEYVASITVTNTYNPSHHVLVYDPNGGTGYAEGLNSSDNQEIVDPRNGATTVKAQGTVSYGDYIFLGWAKTTTGLIYTASDLKDVEIYGPETNVNKTLNPKTTITVDQSMTLYAVWAVDENEDKIPDYLQKTITVNVVWDDDGNRCGIRPTDISFKFNDDTETHKIDLTDGNVLINTNDGQTKWIYKIAGLDATKTYGIIADNVTVQAKAHQDNNDTNGYTPTITAEGNEITITLTHTPETTKHTVTKAWDLGNSGLTPASAEFKLLANGDACATHTMSYDATNNTSSYTWGVDASDSDKLIPLYNEEGEKNEGALPKYEGGALVTYHAIENAVKTSDDADVTPNFKVTYDWKDAENTTEVKNAYSVTRDITLIYEWDDEDNIAGARPQSISIELQKKADNDTWVKAREAVAVTADTNGNWTHTWQDLDKLSDSDDPTSYIDYQAVVVGYTDANGTEHTNITESDDPLEALGYDFDVVSFGHDSVFVMDSALENSREIHLTKTWDYPQGVTHPDSVWLRVYNETTNVTAASVQVTNQATVTVPRYDENGEITYAVSEITTGNFTPAVTGDMTNGFTVTNKLNGDVQDKDYTITFQYQNAYATYEGNEGTVKIEANETFTIAPGKSFTFTAVPNSGYFLQGSAVLVDINKATMSVNGENTYTVSNLTDNVVVTIKAVKQSIGGGGGGGGGGGTTTPPALNTEDHYSYIIGYSDGTVRPNGNITRAEVATIFFRLLTDETRQTYWKQTNSYSDVPTSMWYNNAISTLSNMGIINGYEDGTFRPDGNITRAEFAKIAVGFFETVQKDYQGYFPDVTSSAWYTAYVEAAVEAGLIQGYEDGTFRPDGNITRAESCVIVNRVLGRKPVTENLLPVDEMLIWPDNQPGAWYYADMQEATNSHDYTWTTLKGEKVEKWTQKLAQRDWAALEKAWANGNSAPGGEVVR